MGQGYGRRRGEVELVEPVSTLDAVHDIPRWAGLALKRHRAFAL
jgi:hypothetical protein